MSLPFSGKIQGNCHQRAEPGSYVVIEILVC